ncbi:MAG: hypothetical protein F4Y26_00350 [Gammaproteobacteria bacterium]|nr:hypothetical protein [Gammaproteobacteria bacterium]
MTAGAVRELRGQVCLIAATLLASVLLSSCAEVGYAVLQEPDTPHARSQCDAIHNRTLRERCHARIVPPYEDYVRQREDLTESIRKEQREETP